MVSFSGTAKENAGKKYNNQLRKEGLVPAVIYGRDINKSFSFKPKDIKSLVYTPEFKVAELSLDGETHKCLLKDIQFHPVTDEIVHVDFLALTDGVPVTVKVPITLVGMSPGVKVGGSLISAMRKADIRCLPKDLVDHVTVDISELGLGEAVRVRDIQEQEGITVLNPPATPVANVEVPRALKSAKAQAAAAESGDAE